MCCCVYTSRFVLQPGHGDDDDDDDEDDDDDGSDDDDDDNTITVHRDYTWRAGLREALDGVGIGVTRVEMINYNIS